MAGLAALFLYFLTAELPELGQRLQTRGEWTSRLFGF